MKVLPIKSYENKPILAQKKTINSVQNPITQKEENVSFKGFPIADFVRGIKNTYPQTEVVNENIGKGILYKKLKEINPRLLQPYNLKKLLDSLPIKTPQAIDALAKILDLRSKSVSWSMKLDAQMIPFFEHEQDKGFSFNEELFNIFFKEADTASKSPNAKYEFYIDNFLKLIPFCEDKNGIHPEIIRFANSASFQPKHLKVFQTGGFASCYDMNLVNYFHELMNLDLTLSTKNVEDVKEILYDKNKCVDKEALEFYKEQLEEDSHYLPRVVKFIEILKDKDDKFQAEYKDYYEKLNTSWQYNVFPELWNYKLNHPKEDIIPALDKTVEICDYIKKNKPNNYSEIQDNLMFMLENNHFEEFKNIHQSYGKNLTLKHIKEIIETCCNKSGRVVPRTLSVAEEIFTNLRVKEKLVSYTLEQEALSSLLNAVVDEEGRVDLYKYKLVKDNHNKPYPAYILSIFLNGKGSLWIARRFPETMDYFTQFIEKYGDKVEVAEGFDKNYYLAKKCKEYLWYTDFDKNKIADVEKYMPVFGIEHCDKFLNDYKIRENESIEQVAAIAELLMNNKQKLKNFNEDLTDDVIAYYLQVENEACVDFYNSVGKATFQEAFNFKFEKFRKFVRFFDENFVTYNRFLDEKINPQISEKFINLETKLKKEKNRLRLALTPKQRELIETNKAKIKELEENITSKNKKQTLQEIKTLKKEIQDVYRSLKLKPYIDKINKYSAEKNQLLSDAIKDPAKAIELLDSVLKLYGIITNDELKEYIKIASKNNGYNQKELNEYVNKLVFKYNDIPYSEALSNKLNFTKNKYLPKLLANTNDECKQNLIELCQIVERDKTNNNKAMFDTLEQNIQTKKIFKKHKIDYNKWTGYDPNSNIILQSSMDYNAMKEAAIRNLEVDMSEVFWKNIPREEIEKIHIALREKGYEISDKIFRKDSYFLDDDRDEVTHGFMREIPRLTKNGEVIKFEDLEKVISIIKKVFEKENFWNMKNSDTKVEEAKETLVTHIAKMRYNEIQEILSTKKDNSTLKVQKTDMNDIGHALFLGNHANCCTAIGTGSNSWTAPLYIMNKCVQSIEVVDDNEFVGNTMIFLAEVDGKLALLLDNIELKGKYQYNNNVRDAIFEYAEKLCAEIGQPDMSIYAGPLRHKVNLEKYDHKEHKVEILGKSNEEIYVDSMSNHQIGNKKHNVELYKIK